MLAKKLLPLWPRVAHRVFLSCCISVVPRGFLWASRLLGRKGWDKTWKGKREEDAGRDAPSQNSSAGVERGRGTVGPAGLTNATEVI